MLNRQNKCRFRAFFNYNTTQQKMNVSWQVHCCLQFLTTVGSCCVCVTFYQTLKECVWDWKTCARLPRNTLRMQMQPLFMWFCAILTIFTDYRSVLMMHSTTVDYTPQLLSDTSDKHLSSSVSACSPSDVYIFCLPARSLLSLFATACAIFFFIPHCLLFFPCTSCVPLQLSWKGIALKRSITK